MTRAKHRRKWRAKWRNRPLRDTYPQSRKERRDAWRAVWPRVGKDKDELIEDGE